ncbi:hypothetical protein ART_3638 [Arthrobacter sp. PAMC 25486]|nr:hypothetical protein ART_3638 [Arthrobacter sp. PAMC 25486]
MPARARAMPPASTLGQGMILIQRDIAMGRADPDGQET